tara:strand:- start:416 stop:625 length:210 start_codon:yes stop_codon:yes gene_type:complete
MKKRNKSEFINWFIPVLFALIGQKYLFNLFDFKYDIFNDSFDIAKFMIDFGVFIALFSCAYFAIGYLKQ